MGWLGIWFGAAATSVLMACVLGWALLNRFVGESSLCRALDRWAPRGAMLSAVGGIVLFVTPVLAYWLSAHSHGNALAGFLPWNDATGYFQCSQGYLFGLDPSDQCRRRPFYPAFFAGLLWLTDNQLQPALVLQSLLVGAVVVLFVREVAQQLDGPGVIAAYAVPFLFAAVLSSGLVMTENAGLLLGLLALAILWPAAERAPVPAVLLAFAVMAAAQNARAGAMLVLPALIVWIMLHGRLSWRRRAGLAAGGFLAMTLGYFLASAPSLIVDGTLGGSQANFSYSLYGLVSGGKKWVYVYEARPDLFAAGGSEADVARRIYRAALESVLARPDLAAIGYLKGLGEYFEDLFKIVGVFKPLKFAVFLPLWLIGLWVAFRRRHEPRFALLLWLQLGIVLSAPFISFDGINRVYAATMGVDAAFVGLGASWLSGHLAGRTEVRRAAVDAAGSAVRVPEVAGISLLLLPLLFVAAARAVAAPSPYPPPACDSGLEPIVVRPGYGTLVLPLVAPGEERLYPLRVRADHFAARMDKSVENQLEFRRAPGTVLVWGTRLDAGQFGQAIRFAWTGDLPPAGQTLGVCVAPPEPGSGRDVGTARNIQPQPAVAE